MDGKICYCFGFTKADIVADLKLHDGRSAIVEKISQAKLAGECRCAELHPEGR